MVAVVSTAPFARAQRATLAFAAGPAEEKADQLPHGVQTQATRHHRVANEVAVELFRSGSISFTDITRYVQEILRRLPNESGANETIPRR